MAPFTETIRTVWKDRQGDATALRAVVDRKLSQVKTRKNTLVNRWLDEQVDQKPMTRRSNV